LDAAGRIVAKQRVSENGIDSVAVEGHRVLIGMNGGEGLRMFILEVSENTPRLRDLWANADVGNCWNVAFGNFGGRYAIASTNSSGDVHLLTAEGKERIARDFGYASDLGTLPLSPGQHAVIAIPSQGDMEDVVALREDSTLFRKRLGKETESGPRSWRARRVVAGRFLGGDEYNVAILRGDGSVVVIDAAGKPVSFLPAVESRMAIELGGPERGHDTILCCEAGKIRRFLIPQATPAAVAESLAEVKNPNEELLRIKPEDTADDLLARAFWLSNPSNQASHDEITTLLTAALSRSRDKAPIYFAFGDLTSGPHRMLEMFSGVQARFQNEFRNQLEREIGEMLDAGAVKDQNVAATVLNAALRDSYGKAAESVLKGVTEFSDALQKDADASVMYYVAAVAEDPDYKPAWFRLAKYAKGDLRLRAISRLIQLDPGNAMPYFLRAVAEAEAGDLTAAFKSVQFGQTKRECRCYPKDLPTQFDLRYPDREEFRDYGVVGKPVPPSTFAWLVQRLDDAFAWRDPLDWNLRGVCRQLFDRGHELLDQGDFEGARQYLEVGREMGFRLMRAEPTGNPIMLTGLGIARMPREDLQRLYERIGDKEKLNAFEASEKTWRRFHELYLTYLDARKVAEADIGSALSGEKDLLKDDTAQIENLLRNASLWGESGEEASKSVSK
jgi:hypothetical protein